MNAVKIPTPPENHPIPKTLHFIWIGDEAKRPDNCIESWAKLNPDYTIKVWGNASLVEHKWINAVHMDAMLDRELNGVADMMRWEILLHEGGIVVDADSVCIRALDDELLDCEAFACWESEVARPGLIAAGYFGCKAGNPFVAQIIQDIKAEKSVTHDMAWKTVGPLRLTESFRKYEYFDLRILPSHYFIPEHFSGVVYKGNGPVYANQMWGSTKRSYDDLHRQQFDAKGALIETAPAANDAAPEPVVEAAPEPAPAPAPQVDDYFTQRVKVSTDLMGANRVEVLKQICKGKRVLHIGCADWPITDPNTSLHVALESVCAKLDGFDVQAEALEQLKPYVKGRLFTSFADVKGKYDVVLVPEVLEHVADVEGFLSDLNKVDAGMYVITVPDAFQCHSRHFGYDAEKELFTEVVHPDHNCWYTPFTITNVLKKYTPWTVNGVWFFNSISLLVLATKTPKKG